MESNTSHFRSCWMDKRTVSRPTGKNMFHHGSTDPQAGNSSAERQGGRDPVPVNRRSAQLCANWVETAGRLRRNDLVPRGIAAPFIRDAKAAVIICIDPLTEEALCLVAIATRLDRKVECNSTAIECWPRPISHSVDWDDPFIHHPLVLTPDPSR